MSNINKNKPNLMSQEADAKIVPLNGMLDFFHFLILK